MLTGYFPAIPRALSALIEWYSCVLFLLPLKKRFSSRITLFIIILALGLQMIMQYCASRFVTVSGFFIGMGSNVLLMFLTILVCSKMTVNASLFWAMYAFSTSELISSLIWQITGGAFREISLLAPAAVIVTAALLFISSYFTHLLTRSMNPDVDSYPWTVTFTAVGVTVLQFISSNLMPDILPWQENYWMSVSFGMVRTLLDLAGVMVLFLFMKTLEEQERRKQMDAITRIMDIQHQQHLDFMEASSYISRQCHDLKHQVAALRSVCTQEEQNIYIRELEDMITRYNSYCNTGNKILDSILTQKSIYCGQHNICLSYNVDSSVLSDLSIRELCVIFGNLLDNAIESVEKITEPENRQIVLDVFQKGGFRMIKVENYCKTKPDFTDGLPETTKADAKMHGYGLKSIELTARNHGGTLRCTCEDGWFKAKVLMPEEVPHMPPKDE